MAAKKSDAEKGPLGAWAYGTRDLLDASPEDAAAAAGITYPTLRKIEGGSARQPAKRTVFALWQHYRAIGQAKGIPVEDPPAEWRGTPALLQPSQDGDLTAAIAELVRALDADREERMALTRAIASLAQSLATRQADGESPVRSVPPATTE